jgi:hypothetical protein
MPDAPLAIPPTFTDPRFEAIFDLKFEICEYAPSSPELSWDEDVVMISEALPIALLAAMPLFTPTYLGTLRHDAEALASGDHQWFGFLGGSPGDFAVCR